MKIDYIEWAKRIVVRILNNDGELTFEGLNEIFEIQNGNKEILLEHLKALSNMMNKAIEEIEYESNRFIK